MMCKTSELGKKNPSFMPEKNQMCMRHLRSITTRLHNPCKAFLVTNCDLTGNLCQVKSTLILANLHILQ
jgi:hypothetical protein